jgi:hypothetical protein
MHPQELIALLEKPFFKVLVDGSEKSGTLVSVNVLGDSKSLGVLGDFILEFFSIKFIHFVFEA